MKIYFAGGFCEEKKYDKFKSITWNRRLISYLSYNKQIEEYFFSEPNEIMLDSGAFSAWNSGIVITLDDYMNFLSNHPHINLYYNLDVIGDPENTWRNQKIMEKNGFHPLPVYHFGEERKYLKKCLSYQYFGLGGMVGKKEECLVRWLDNVFSELPYNSKKEIDVKIHGLGMTNFRLLTRYPWYSVDSSSWQQGAAYGHIYVPKKTRNGWDFKNMKFVKITRTSINLESLKPILEFLGIEIGCSIYKKMALGYSLDDDESIVQKRKNDIIIEKKFCPGIINNRDIRCLMNAYCIQQFEKTLPSWPQTFNYKKKRLWK